jgi:hypothetical protein
MAVGGVRWSPYLPRDSPQSFPSPEIPRYAHNAGADAGPSIITAGPRIHPGVP